MAPPRKFKVRVEMDCNVCVERVEEVASTTHGVADHKVDRWNSLLTITETPNVTVDRRKLVKRLKKVTHDKKAEVLPAGTSTETDESDSTTPVIYYILHPYMAPGYLAPWPQSAGSPPSFPIITNPFYLQHPARCHYCNRYSDIVCANCGRGSNY